MANEKHDGGDSSERYDLSKDPYARRPKSGNPITRRGLLIGSGVLGAFGAGVLVEGEVKDSIGGIQTPTTRGTQTDIGVHELEEAEGFRRVDFDTSVDVPKLKGFPPFLIREMTPITMMGGMSEAELQERLRKRTCPVLEPAKPSGDDPEVTTLAEVALPPDTDSYVLVMIPDGATVHAATRSSDSISVRMVPVEGVKNPEGSRLCKLQMRHGELLDGVQPAMDSVYIAINSQRSQEEPVAV
jgi:hypothetical protein